MKFCKHCGSKRVSSTTIKNECVSQCLDCFKLTVSEQEVSMIPRHIELRVIAKKFAAVVRGSGYIHTIPDAIVDKLKDGEVEQFFNILRTLRLRQVIGKGWEEDR